MQESDRPKQAFILSWPFANLGGVNEVVRNLVYEFSRGGNLAPLVIEGMDGSSESESTSGMPILRLAIPLLYNPQSPLKTFVSFCLRTPGFFRRMRSICRQHHIQVLNPHFIALEHLTLVLFRRLGLFRGTVILSLHGSDIRSMMQSKGLERFLNRVLLRGADAVIPCSEGLKQETLLLAPECLDRIVSVPNGIDVPRFLASAAPEFELPAAFETRRRILNVGAFEYKKGHDVLLHAFAEVRRTHADVCLIIAGQTRESFASTRVLVQQLGLEEDVLLVQDISHSRIAALLQKADIFVLSSRWEKGVCGEGFAMALLEAAAAEVPVVSTLSCGVAELIGDGESGAIVPPDQPGALAQALTRMLDNPGAAARQAKTLHDRVSEDFTWKAAHERYLAIVS